VCFSKTEGRFSGALDVGKELCTGDTLLLFDAISGGYPEVVLQYKSFGKWDKTHPLNQQLYRVDSLTRVSSEKIDHQFGENGPYGSLVIGAQNVCGNLLVFFKTFTLEEDTRLQFLACLSKPYTTAPKINVVTYTAKLECVKQDLTPVEREDPKVFICHLIESYDCLNSLRTANLFYGNIFFCSERV
jgi:hypothetical protein